MQETLKELVLQWLSGTYGLARLEGDAKLPTRAKGSAELISISRTNEELSIIVPEQWIPQGVSAERDFVVFRVAGTLEFTQTGILARLTTTLAAASIPVAALSTFDTDYILLKAGDRERAEQALRGAGCRWPDDAGA